MGFTEQSFSSLGITRRDTVSTDSGANAPSLDEWHELIVEASTDGNWFWDIERDAIYYSPRLLDILDFHDKGNEFSSEDPLTFVHPDDYLRYKQTLARHLKGQTDVFQIEMRVFSGKGDVRWVLNRGVARRNESGRAYCMLGSVVDITNGRQLEDSLRIVALSATEGTTPEFFESLVRYLAEALHSDFAIVGRLDRANADRINTIAVYRDGDLGSNFQYELVHSPCRNVVGREICFYPEKAAQLFPQDRMLAEEQIEAYIGSPLFDSNGEAIGLIVALFRRPISEMSTAEYLLKIFASRAAAEMERQASRLSKACVRALDGTTPDNVGTAVQAALQGAPGVVEACFQDNDNSDSDFAVAVRKSGYDAVFAVAIRDQHDMALGTLAVFTKGANAVNHPSNELLREMAQIASIAIEQNRLSEALALQTHYDRLTELPNRVLLMDRLAQAILDASRGNYPVGVLLLDIDEFKLINDSLGHGAGDRLLKEVAERLGECSRAGDTVARLGGDEFALVVSLKNGADYCADIAERVLEVLQQNVRIGEREVNARPSMGISLYPQDGETPEALLQAADTAMYAAKHAGKNQYRYFAEGMNRQVSERLQVESELQEALRNGELELHYQPRVILDTGKICGAEALLRWRHPQRGLLVAGEFIAIAERSPLMSEIDHTVLCQAAQRLAAWQGEGRRLVLSVNVSARELHADDFADKVGRGLETAGVDAADLELEITESMLMRDYERARRQLTELKERARGLRIAIDDFGTGYSSLNHLRQLPIDTLKIDRSFVADLDDSQEATAGAIVKTIVELGRNLDLTVVAEGVERPTQTEWLRRYGCDQGQGYLYAKALPADEFADRLRQS
ncbi:MAG: putative signaling protein [Gammaproteobacteria bacterium]|nr:putative signaling protein [Gammaproteobacteria bacterium]